MTKKDYQEIARILHRFDVGIVDRTTSEEMHAQQNTVTGIREALADYLGKRNPLFNRSLFLEACKTGKCKGMPPRTVAGGSSFPLPSRLVTKAKQR